MNATPSDAELPDGVQSAWTTLKPVGFTAPGFCPLCEPTVVSMGSPRQQVRVQSYLFPDPLRIDENSANGPAPSWARRSAPRNHAGSRFRPPRDMIKLKDRLQVLLQPPLEALAADGRITFPQDPFPHQFQGVAFLFPRNAAILADEMGLGKTMQAVTSIRLLLRCGHLRSVLLICPKPLVTNWIREFRHWAGEIPVHVIQGSTAQRNWQWQHANSPIKIANYELIPRDQATIAQTGGFDLVVLDEAQRIKNRNNETSRSIRAIQRRRSWALTGTPVENSPEDLVGIFEFLSSGLLSSTMSPRQMASEVRDYILRRTKSQILTDLPPVLDRDAQLELSAAQRETYEQAENDGVIRLNEMGAEITIHHVFELVLRLKQICNFDPASGASCKMERLQADLEEVVSSGQKAIVFSQWVHTLQSIHQALQCGNPLEYHGRIPTRRREGILREFQQDPCRQVLLMSYGAGSVGLNLQFCSYVFLFDRWWNPAVEDQAINRAHRIGSKSAVTVTRLITCGTIEERIDQVLQDKRQLFRTILSDAERLPQHSLSREEIFGLFQLQAPPLRAARRPAGRHNSSRSMLQSRG